MGAPSGEAIACAAGGQTADCGLPAAVCPKEERADTTSLENGLSSLHLNGRTDVEALRLQGNEAYKCGDLFNARFCRLNFVS